ncbi:MULTISPECIES: hypothetical protein [unclassified Streptomyces]|nr:MULTISPECIES: hypothetical protein [unclassified Streptomyces]
MSENSTDGQEPNGSGKHRGDAAPTEDSASSPHGRHRREPESQTR